MRITKYEHATLSIEKGASRVVVDPGSFLTTLTDFSGIDIVVITHKHADHWTPSNLKRILEHNQNVRVLAPQGVADDATGVEVTVVAPGDRVELAGFTFEFFGGVHAMIHESIPLIDNVGVFIDDQLYYPGDSYSIPEGRDVGMLAAPLGAPWLKIGESMDFVVEVNPRQCFGTHDMTLSVAGRPMHAGRVAWATEQGGGIYHDLAIGDSVTI